MKSQAIDQPGEGNRSIFTGTLFMYSDLYGVLLFFPDDFCPSGEMESDYSWCFSLRFSHEQKDSLKEIMDQFDHYCARGGTLTVGLDSYSELMNPSAYYDVDVSPIMISVFNGSETLKVVSTLTYHPEKYHLELSDHPINLSQ